MSTQICVACEKPFDRPDPFVAVCPRCAIRMRIGNAAAKPEVAATENGRSRCDFPEKACAALDTAIARDLLARVGTAPHPVLVQAIRYGQVIHFIIGICGEGSDHRAVETAFALLPGDTLVVYRQGGA